MLCGNDEIVHSRGSALPCGLHMIASTGITPLYKINYSLGHFGLISMPAR
jgi:hypothetical protein